MAYGMNKYFLLMAACAGLQSSCMVTTSVAVAESCVYQPRIDRSQSPEIYRMGDAYYLKLSVRYVCEAERVTVGGVVAVPDSELRLPISYHDEYAPQPMYVQMDADAVRYYVGISPKPPDGKMPGCFTAENWDATQARLCKPIRPIPQHRVSAYETSHEARCSIRKAKDSRYDTIDVYLPSTYSWDAVYKFPLAALLAVVVDVPATVAGTVGGLTLGTVVTFVASPFSRHQQQLQVSDDFEEFDDLGE